MFFDWETGGLPPARLFSRRTGEELTEEVLCCDEDSGDYWVSQRIGAKVVVKDSGDIKRIHRVCPGGIRVEWLTQHKSSTGVYG